MIKTFCKKHKILCFIVCLVLIVFGIELSAAIKESNRVYITGTITPYQNNGIKTYNVEGLSDEEIENYIKEQREKSNEN